MSVVIRMKRAGAKKRPFYRVVVANSRSPRDGRYIEQLGYYDPLTDPATFRVDADRFAEWIRRGALPSESVGVMVAKHAPEALRPAPMPAAEAASAAAAEPKPKKAKAAKPKKAAKSPAARKPKTTTKGSEKKAKTRAKAKAKRAQGGAKPKAAKKSSKK